MLDIGKTRENFLNWVRSPAYDAHFNAMSRPSHWRFWLGGLLVLSVAGIIPGIALLIGGFRRNSARKAARRNAHVTFAGHQPLLCGLVIGNRMLFGQKGAVAPALLVGTFRPEDPASLDATLKAAALIGGLYGEEPASVPPEHQEVCRMVNDDAYRPNRRRPLPPHLFPGMNLILFDAILSGDHFESGMIDDALIPCMASPAPQGGIIHLNPALVAITKENSVIRHTAPVQPPPLVAPVSENLDAIEAHITRHLGEPSSVFHELVSTTIHVDVHIVRPTPDRPWLSLVTSGMSDIPMTAPAGAEEYRFAELMIRLPPDWKIDEESLKSESNYWPIRSLKFLARFPHEYQTWLSYGHSIPNGDPPAPFNDTIPFCGMVLSPPWIGGDEFATLRLADGTPVHFWSLIPLHASEITFKLQHGSEALFERIAKAGYSDLFNPRRPAVA